jgi:GT2 family glycosyltransferase
MPVVGIDEDPRVVAIIPTLGADAARLERCVDALVSGAGGVRLAILIVLNSSTVQLEPIPGATVQVAGLNLGLPGGVAFGAAISRSELLWLVQDDMVVDESCLERLVAALDDAPDVGAVGPVVVDEHGLVPEASCGGILVDGAIEQWMPQRPCPPDELTGLESLSYLPSRGLLARRTAFDAAGGMNPRMYPVQFADVDFSLRLRRAGSDFRMITSARTRHSGAASTPRAFALFLHERNLLTLRAEWFPDAPPHTPRFVEVAPSRPDEAGMPRHPLHPDLDPALLAEIARSASDALTHLGRVHNAGQDQLQHTLGEVERLREQVRVAEGDLVHARRDIGTLGTDLAAARDEAEELRSAVIEARALLVETGEDAQRLREALAASIEERDAAASALATIQSSTSWRITAPLRRRTRD